MADTDLIPAKIITEEATDFITDNISATQAAHKVTLAMLKSWEETLDFKYTRYPELD